MTLLITMPLGLKQSKNWSYSPRSWSVQRKKVRPVTLSRRTHDAMSLATRSGSRSPDRTLRVVVRYTDSCEGVHVFGLSGKSSSGSIDNTWLLSAKYVGSVSARGLRYKASPSGSLRCGCVGEGKGEGRGNGSSPVRLLDWR
jgi:hypothetical protein